MNFAKLLTAHFLIEHLRWPLLEPFLGCQPIWYFNRNTIFSRMNIIFFSDVGNVTFKYIFFGTRCICFVFFQKGNVTFVRCLHISRKYIAMYFWIKIIFFHFLCQEETSYFYEKRNAIFPDITKKLIFMCKFFEKDCLFGTFEESIIFPRIFFEKDHLPFRF